MTILDALKANEIDRISVNDRWLIWDTDLFRFVVYEHKPHARQSTRLIETACEDEAVAVLISD